MPVQNRQCFLCGRFNRGSRSLLMTIDHPEQESRIRSGYVRRHKREIVGAVMGAVVHRTCYRSLVQREPLAVTRSKSYPGKYLDGRKKKQSQSQDSNPSTSSCQVLPITSSDEDAVRVTLNELLISVEQTITQHTSLASYGNASANIRVNDIRFESHDDQEVCTERESNPEHNEKPRIS